MNDQIKKSLDDFEEKFVVETNKGKQLRCIHLSEKDLTKILNY